MTYKSADWIDHDFRPAPPGWRLVYLTDSTSTPTHVVDLPGWLVQRRGMHDRRVVAANFDPAGQLYPAGDAEVGPLPTYEADHFWCVLGPTDPVPTREEAAAVRAERPRPCIWCAAKTNLVDSGGRPAHTVCTEHAAAKLYERRVRAV